MYMEIPLAACTIEKIRKKITEYLHISKKSSTFAVAFAEWRSARPVPQAGVKVLLSTRKRKFSQLKRRKRGGLKSV